MEEIKAILFDIGGVILYESVKESRNILCRKFGIKPEDFKRFTVKNIPLSYTGKLHYNNFFKNLVKETKIQANPKDLVKEWIKAREKTSKPNKKVISLLKPLSKKYKIVCLTDSTMLNDKSKQRKYAYKLFKMNFISCRLGHMKPQKKIYQIAIKRLKLKPEQMLFIDNSRENLEGAKKLGLKTLFADNNLDKNLRKLL
jgi:putative hydrolase of the HAD superfamily